MMQQTAPTSTTVTKGVRIIVRSRYVPEHSLPLIKRYTFTYSVRIENEGKRPVRLRSRHWIISDGEGKVQDMRGPGVVGEQPLLAPGEHFEYTSRCILQTPSGQMHGSYQMEAAGGTMFDALIAPFALLPPYALN